VSELGHAPKKKLYHMAALVSEDGSVSALCFDLPHAIDLHRSLWTIRPEAVTCRRCRAALSLMARAGRGSK